MARSLAADSSTRSSASTNFARSRRAAATAAPTEELHQQQQMEAAARAPGGLEARMAGVVVAALKEAFDRDHAPARAGARAAGGGTRARRAGAAAGAAASGRDREIGRLRLLADRRRRGMAGDAAARCLARQPDGVDDGRARRARPGVADAQRRARGVVQRPGSGRERDERRRAATAPRRTAPCRPAPRARPRRG